MMTSTFVDLRDGMPTKVAFSAQEWCGQAYSQLLFDDDGVRYTSHSYFDGEADEQRTLERGEGLAEDALLHWARGLAGPQLQPGESARVELLRSLEHARLGHVAVDSRAATLTRSQAKERVEVPAGRFEVDRLTVELDAGRAMRLYPPGRGEAIEGARSWTFWVESDAPHRLVRWSRSDGLDAKLLASDRMPYWSLNGNGLERELARLGLAPRPERAP